jgi:FAD:protein FMN transferase
MYSDQEFVVELVMPQSLQGLHRLEHIMGMPIGIDIRDTDVDPLVLDRAFDWLRWVDATFSTFKQDSEISRLNAGDLTMAEVHPEVRAVLDRCEELRLETDGFFEVRSDDLPVPVQRASGLVTSSGIDPSGLVKGWSVDRAAQILEDAGASNYSINAGGDVRIRGGALPQDHWRVGIQHPFIGDKVAAVVAGSNLAIATSGTYQRGQHIVDPHTGKPPTGVLSVTIVGPELATADAYATAAFAMGENGPEWTARLTGYESMTILEDETVLKTRWFPSA